MLERVAIKVSTDQSNQPNIDVFIGVPVPSQGVYILPLIHNHPILFHSEMVKRVYTSCRFLALLTGNFCNSVDWVDFYIVLFSGKTYAINTITSA